MRLAHDQWKLANTTRHSHKYRSPESWLWYRSNVWRAFSLPSSGGIDPVTTIDAQFHGRLFVSRRVGTNEGEGGQ